MREIPLTNGYAALVDDDDYAAAARFKWHAKVDRRRDGTIRNVYGKRHAQVNGKQQTIYLHRFIVGANEQGIEVDHRNHNGLDCRRENLRIGTKAQNHYNLRKIRGTSQFKGVSWFKRTGQWRAIIKFGFKQKCLGYFDSEKDAALAYDAAARELFGEFAATNFKK